VIVPAVLNVLPSNRTLRFKVNVKAKVKTDGQECPSYTDHSNPKALGSVHACKSLHSLYQLFAQDKGRSASNRWRLGRNSTAAASEEKMSRVPSSSTVPNVTIRVSGKLFQGHLSYLDQLVQTALACDLWALLDLTHLEELDRAAVLYLMRGEGHGFGVVSCPNFVREWMSYESAFRAA
jgi:hypothetical protein